MTAMTMLIAWAIEAAFGWPDGLYRRIRHPVVWIGWLITRLDQRLNRTDASTAWRAVAGGFATCVVVIGTWAATVAVVELLPQGLVGAAVQGVIASSFLASRSLYEHVAAVGDSLGRSLASARTAVAHIVGRDPDQLDDAGVARAGLESLAENTSDGMVAPLFWGVLLGLPGIAAYKAINTLDSMIGHRNARYEHFGKCAARLDDAANWLPARLTAGAFALATRRPARIWRIVWQDARRHRSPNAGWPEAAMAGALGVRLSGPRRYGNETVQEPWLNGGAPDPDASAVHCGLRVYVTAMQLTAGFLAILACLQVLL